LNAGIRAYAILQNMGNVVFLWIIQKYTRRKVDKERKVRIGTAYGCEMIRCLLLSLKVNDFSEMKGKIIWVIGEGEGFDFKPTGIQMLKVDDNKSEPIIFSNILNEFKAS